MNSQKVGGYQGQGNPASPRLPLLVGIVVSVLAGLFGATQFFAYQFGGQAALGSNLAGFYPPWRILTWAAAWYANFSPVFMTAAALGMGIVMLGFLGVFILKMVSQNTARAQDTLHGSARWATKADIEAAGLLNNDGVYVGAWREPGSWWRKGRLYYLRDDSSQHVLTYAPPRSGKGVGLVIPTLLSWPHSVVVNDLKGELWELTSGWRKHHAGNKVLRQHARGDFGNRKLLHGPAQVALGITHLKSARENNGQSRPGNDAELAQFGNGARQSAAFDGGLNRENAADR